MTNGYEFDKPAAYRIRVKGRLDPKWSDWFGGFEITSTGGETLLIGVAADQSALYGLLAKLGELGLTLLSITRTGFTQQSRFSQLERRFP